MEFSILRTGMRNTIVDRLEIEAPMEQVMFSSHPSLYNGRAPLVRLSIADGKKGVSCQLQRGSTCALRGRGRVESIGFGADSAAPISYQI